MPGNVAAVLPSGDGAALLTLDAAANDFFTDANAHCKFIGHTPDAAVLFEATGLAALVDDGYIALDASAADRFIAACRDLRSWAREPAVDGL